MDGLDMVLNVATIVVGVALGTLIGTEIMWRRMMRKIKRFVESGELTELLKDMRKALLNNCTTLPPFPDPEGEMDGGET